jgi:hypothetical protein
MEVNSPTGYLNCVENYWMSVLTVIFPETHEAFVKATTSELKVERVGEGYLAFMFHISTHCAVTKYALERSGVLDRKFSASYFFCDPLYLLQRYQ